MNSEKRDKPGVLAATMKQHELPGNFCVIYSDNPVSGLASSVESTVVVVTSCETGVTGYIE